MNNKKKCINIIAYIIVVILAVFYLATLVLGSKLNVSDEYKLYYVDGELSKWPGENGLDYYFGNTEIYDISKLEEYKKLLENMQAKEGLKGHEEENQKGLAKKIQKLNHLLRFKRNEDVFYKIANTIENK